MRFPGSAEKAYEAITLPMAFYKNENGVPEPILVTDGFCSLMEMDHEQLISHLRGSTYEKVHPDDAGKLMKAVSAFLDGRTGFDVIYRSRLGLDSDYHYVHSAGTKVRMPDGGELMAVVYLDLNKCIDETEKLSADYRQLQADHFTPIR